MLFKNSLKVVATIVTLGLVAFGGITVENINASQANAIVANGADGPFKDDINWIDWGTAGAQALVNVGDVWTSKTLRVNSRNQIQCTATLLKKGGEPFHPLGSGLKDVPETSALGTLEAKQDNYTNPFDKNSWSYFQKLYQHPNQDPQDSIILGNHAPPEGKEYEYQSFRVRVNCKGIKSDDGFKEDFRPTDIAGLVFADAEHMSPYETIKMTPKTNDTVKWSVLKSGYDPQVACANHEQLDYDAADKSVAIRASGLMGECRPTTILYMNGGSESAEAGTTVDFFLLGEGVTSIAVGAVGGSDEGDGPESYGWSSATISGALSGYPVTETIPDLFEKGIGDQGKFNRETKPRLGATITPDVFEDHNNTALDDDGWDLAESKAGLKTVLSDGQDSALIPKFTAKITCTGDDQNPRAVGWIDFNKNGVFDDPDERSDEVNCGDGSAPVERILTWNVPQYVDTTEVNWMRLRVSSTKKYILPVGSTENGEVEDWKIKYQVVRWQRSKDIVKATQNTPALTPGKDHDHADMFPGLKTISESEKFTPVYVLVDQQGNEIPVGQPIDFFDPDTHEKVGTYTLTLVDGNPKVTFQPDIPYANKKSANISVVSEYTAPPVTVRVKGSTVFGDIDSRYTPTVIIKPTLPLNPFSVEKMPGETVEITPVFPADDAGHDGVVLTTVKLVKPADCANCVLSTDGKTLTVPGQGVWTVDPVTGNMKFKPEDGFIGNPTPVNYTATSTQDKPMGEATLTVTYIKVPGIPQSSVDVQGVDQSMKLADMFKNLPPNADTQPNYSLEGADADGSVTVKGPDGKVQGKYTIDKASGKVIFHPEADYYGTPAPVTVVLTPHVGGDPIKATYQPRVLNISFAIPLTGIDGGQALVYGVLGAVVLAVVAAGAVNARRRQLA